MIPLPRVLGPWMAAAIVVGTVIGSGVFKKSKNIATDVPQFGLGISVWIVGGLITLAGALVLAEVAVRLPRAGGNYVFLREGFGRRWAFLWGWIEFWIIRTASIAALAALFTDSLHAILKEANGTNDEVISYWPRQAFTIALIAVLTLVNILGTRLGATVQLVLTTIKVISIIAIAVLPFVVLAVVGTPAHPPRMENLQPMWPSDWSAVNWSAYGSALVAVFWVYDGWMNIGPVAEEVRNPGRNLPLAVIGGVLLLITLYVSANFAYYLVMPREDIIRVGSTPVATVFCYRLLGNAGILIASLILMTSVLGSANGNILIGPRLFVAMGRDGLIPQWLYRVNEKYGTPAAATVTFSTWAALLIVIGGLLTHVQLPMVMGVDLNLSKDKELFDVLTDYAMVGQILMGTLACAAIFPLRMRNAEEVPYRCPLYPALPIVYCVVMAAVFLNMYFSDSKRTEAWIGTGFLIIGLMVYELFYRRRG